MNGAGWIDKSRRKVKDWHSKARRLYGIWLHDRGGRAAEARHAAAAVASVGAVAAIEDARKRFADLSAHAKAGRWADVKAGEAAWRVADSKTFQSYIERKRPPEWLQQIAALAAGRPQKAR